MTMSQAPAPTTRTELQIRAESIQRFLVSKKGAFNDLLPKHLTAEKMVKGVLALATRSPRLLECTPISILNAVLVSSSLGLEIGRPRGGMYLVPFKNKRGQYEATPIADYRGLMDLAFRSGRVLAIEAFPVYKLDEFSFQYGTDAKITHKPTLGTRGDLLCVYAVARLSNGQSIFRVLTLEDLENTRQRSRAKDDGPWVTDTLAMQLKTAIRRICNWLPQAQEMDLLDKALAVEARAEAGEGISDLFDVVTTAEDLGSEDTPAADPDKQAILAGAKRASGKAAPPPAPAAPQEQEEQHQTGDPGPGMNMVEGAATDPELTPLNLAEMQLEDVFRKDGSSAMIPEWNKNRKAWAANLSPGDFEKLKTVFEKMSAPGFTLE
ncbi:MAG: recombinase RecT [Patescibacteria group bacterium]|nr:recombinase RecT [Patescibacteria group bacterium]